MRGVFVTGLTRPLIPTPTSTSTLSSVLRHQARKSLHSSDILALLHTQRAIGGHALWINLERDCRHMQGVGKKEHGHLVFVFACGHIKAATVIEDTLGEISRKCNLLHAALHLSNSFNDYSNLPVFFQTDKGREVTSDLGLLETVLGRLVRNLEQAVVEGTVSESSGWLGGMQSKQEHAARRRHTVQRQ